ncbi:MAG: thiamine pyrophosphate-dependent dehydrogenase E1 component subunit alpha [Candidatus Sericytochromatia bacterium]
MSALQNLDSDKARSILYDMLRIRRVEEKIEKHYHEDKMKTPVHLVIGHEAVSVGVIAALNADDELFCTYRSHGHYLAKGGDLKAMLAELHCRSTGCVGSRGGSMHLLDLHARVLGCSAIVGGIVPIAAGNALAQLMRHQPQLTVVFFGDAATEEGVVWETMNYAALRKLPLLVVCENNFYSVCSPVHQRQPEGTSILAKAEAFGIPGESADGTDVLSVYAAAQRAVARIRAGEGPAFIEIPVYRWRGHHGSGDDSHTGYRDPAEVSHWQSRCPVESYATRLAEANLLETKGREAMETAITTEIEAAFNFALESPEPADSEVLEYVYAK